MSAVAPIRKDMPEQVHLPITLPKEKVKFKVTSPAFPLELAPVPLMRVKVIGSGFVANLKAAFDPAESKGEWTVVLDDVTLEVDE